MNGDKRIEEMAEAIYAQKNYDTFFYPQCEYLAIDLYNAGYRKASEVAREIFEEIEKMLLSNKIEAYKTLLNDTWLYRSKINIFTELHELKKKYTEGEG